MVLPPLCISCDSMVGSLHGFCPTCWAGLDFITPPSCACCGLPFPFEGAGAENLCGACLQERPAFTAARGVLRYAEASKKLILPFKHSDRTDFAPAFARLMGNAGADWLKEIDAILPVPLHGMRLFLRRYNQAALLALELARLSEKPVLLDTLVRTRATISQGKLTRAQRLENLRGAFAVKAKRIDKIKGASLLLVDDVMTTGATVNMATQALLKAGAKEVRVLCLARVTREE